MPRFIDVEMACDEVDKGDLLVGNNADFAKEIIRRTPSADVVGVTRCKDCKHNVANWQHDDLDATDYTDIVCDYFMTDGMEPDDYCSYGERRMT